MPRDQMEKYAASVSLWNGINYIKLSKFWKILTWKGSPLDPKKLMPFMKNGDDATHAPMQKEIVMACENCRSVELLSNEELIQELMLRATFLGIVLYSQNPVKGNNRS